MSYQRTVQIEFQHCDPAGIVFYPRYFEMTNSLVENFFGDVVGFPYSRIIEERKGHVPTVHIEVDFSAPSRLGEKVNFILDVRSVGRSSVRFAIRAEKDGEKRLSAELVLVWVSFEGGALPWPEEMKAKLENAMQEGKTDEFVSA